MLQRRSPVSPGLLLVAIHKHISHFTILAKSTLYYTFCLNLFTVRVYHGHQNTPPLITKALLAFPLAVVVEGVVLGHTRTSVKVRSVLRHAARKWATIISCGGGYPVYRLGQPDSIVCGTSQRDLNQTQGSSNQGILRNSLQKASSTPTRHSLPHAEFNLFHALCQIKFYTPSWPTS